MNNNENKEPHPIRDSHTTEFVPNPRARYYVIGGIACFILLLFLIGFLPRLAIWRENDAIAAKDHIPEVRVLEIKPENNPVKLTLPSTTTAIRFTPLWARVDGYIDNFFVDIGDRVKEGQLLATIETPEIDKELLQARAQLLNSVATYEIAKISADRWTGLYDRNPQAVPKQEVDERQTTLKASEASVKAAQANVERLEKLVAFKHIYAPFDGVITERNIDIGSLITAGSAGAAPQQLFMLDKIDVIRVFVSVPQFFFRQISDGLAADVTIQEFRDKVFKGYVARTAGALDPVSRTLLTEVHVDNKEGLLTTGLYANVAFSLLPPKDYFVIPTNSMILLNDGPTVAIVDNDNTVKIVPVKLGRDYGKNIEIISGLKEHDKVVIQPGDGIRENAKVKIRPPEINKTANAKDPSNTK